jgi:hypothetical protein
MRILVLTATYELRVSRKSHLRDHPSNDIGGTLYRTLYTDPDFNEDFLTLLFVAVTLSLPLFDAPFVRSLFFS